MPLLTESFSLIRVLNLRDRPDRLREITAQLAALGLSFTPGKLEVYSATRPTELGGFRTIGAHGCYLTHLAVLRDALNRSVESILVLEDDCEIHGHHKHSIGVLASQLVHREWSFAFLGHIQQLPAPESVRPELVPFSGPLQNAHCYAVHRSALAALVAYLEACLTRPPGDPIGGPMDVDGAITMFRAANPQFVTLLANPSLASQRSSRSDITFHRYELIPGLQQAIALARRAKRALRRLVP